MISTLSLSDLFPSFVLALHLQRVKQELAAAKTELSRTKAQLAMFKQRAIEADRAYLPPPPQPHLRTPAPAGRR